MLSSYLLLSSSASDLLRTVSKLLRGEVPCAPAKLAKALRAAKAADCEGLLRDDAVRTDLAKRLESSKIEIANSNASAAALIDELQAVIEKRVETAKAEAEKFAKALPKGTVSYEKLVATKGAKVSEAMKRDWGLWHQVGNTHSPNSLPVPKKEELLNERLSLVCTVGDGPVGECVLALHVLEKSVEYTEWEMSLAGSKPVGKCTEVQSPFDEKTANEVAARRVLSRVLPLETASLIASQLKGHPEKAMKPLAEEVRKAAMIPLFAAEVVKDPKEAKEAKGEKKEKAAKGDAAPPAAKGGAAAAPAETSAPWALHKATATEELQWHLLAYCMQPGTNLSAAAGGNKGKGGGAAADIARPAGFVGTWAPSTGQLPPGHTEYSWLHAEAAGMKDGFATTWSPGPGQLPPGHTPNSWELALAAN